MKCPKCGGVDNGSLEFSSCMCGLTKPREWWVAFLKRKAEVYFSPPNNFERSVYDDVIRVIEFSAYEKLLKENAELRAERDRYFIALEEIEFKCSVTSEVGAIARKALEAP